VEPYDEAIEPSGRPRPLYERVWSALATHDLERLRERVQSAVGAGGMTFGPRHPIAVDPVPRLISAEEWEALAAGLRQRLRALNAFVADVYGPQRIFEAGAVPRRLLESSPGLARLRAADARTAGPRAPGRRGGGAGRHPRARGRPARSRGQPANAIRRRLRRVAARGGRADARRGAAAAAVRTFDLGDRREREEAMERIDELVVKPRDGFGGAGITIMPRADEDDRRRAVEDARRRPPEAGEMVVNSSQGGGRKDTWVVDGEAPG
jgi:uncharacterized circularly permuted ATP-grasp superfamily protein